jgi:hypothetical protein
MPGISKPPPGTQVNWTHPLARGLIEVYLFNGGRPVGLVHGKPVLNASSATPKFDETGVAITAANMQQRVPLPRFVGRSITVAVLGAVSSFTGSYGALYGDRNNRPFALNEGAATGNLTLTFDDKFWDITTGPPVPLDGIQRLHYASARPSGGASSVVHLGVGKDMRTVTSGSQVNSAGVVTGGSGTNCLLGLDPGGGAQGARGTYQMVAVWNRYMDPHELAVLENNPFVFLTPPTRTTRYFAIFAAYFQTLDATQTQTATIRRAIAATKAVTQTQTATLSRAVSKALSLLTQTQTPTMLRAVAKQLSTVTQTQTATLARAVGKVLGVTSTQTPTIRRAVAKVLGALTQTQTPSLTPDLIPFLRNLTLTIGRAMTRWTVDSIRSRWKYGPPRQR